MVAEFRIGKLAAAGEWRVHSDGKILNRSAPAVLSSQWPTPDSTVYPRLTRLTQWNMEPVFDTVKFITVIHGFPQLWDKSNSCYGDRRKKDSAWRMSMVAMYGEDELKNWETGKRNHMAKDLQTKWKSLRNSFTRELAKKKKTKSESAKSWKTYKYFDMLSFLIPSIAHAEDHSNLSPEEDDEVESEETAGTGSQETRLWEPQADKPSTSGSRKRKSARSDCEDGLAAVLAKTVKWEQERDEVFENTDRLFLLSLLDDFKKVPSSRKAALKIAMITAINNAVHSQHHPSSYFSSPNTSIYPAVHSQPPYMNPNHSRSVTPPPSNSAQNVHISDYDSRNSSDSS